MILSQLLTHTSTTTFKVSRPNPIDEIFEEPSTDQNPTQQPPKRSINNINAASDPPTDNIPVPRNPTVREAIMFPEWTGALKTEFGNHESQGTFKVVDRPGNTRLIPLTWRLQTKNMTDGSVDKYKARLVAAGN